VLLALGYGEALGALAVVVFVIPGSYIVEMLWAAYFPRERAQTQLH
jgi:hypothetical protein